MNEVYFPALFPGFALPEDLAEALERLAVVHAELDRETRTIRLDAQAEHYLAEKQLQSLCLLIETGFISNPSDQKILTSESGQTNIARAIFTAFHRQQDKRNNKK